MLSLLQWNIWREEKIQNIVTFLKAQRPDIFCAQELMADSTPRGYDAAAIIAGELGYHYFQKTLPAAGTMRQANAVFSRFPIRYHSWHWINQPRGTGDYDDQYRVYLEVTLDTPGQPLVVGTTHMSYTPEFADTPSKQAEAAALLAALKPHTQRFIFAGDLNALPGSPIIANISHILTHAGPDMSQGTWTTKPFSHNGFMANEVKWRLDYVFSTPDVKTHSSEVVTTEFSDHLPLLVKFAC